MQANDFKQSVSNTVDQLIVQANQRLQQLINFNYPTPKIEEKLHSPFNSPSDQTFTNAYIEVIFDIPQKSMSIMSFNCNLQDMGQIDETKEDIVEIKKENKLDKKNERLNHPVKTDKNSVNE